MNYLIDTNVVIYFLSASVLQEKALARLDDIFSSGQQISIVTKLELLGYTFDSSENERATEEFVAKSIGHPIDLKTEREIISLRKSYKIKLPDAIIAATAITNDLVLITSNAADFKSIDKMKIINPFDLQ